MTLSYLSALHGSSRYVLTLVLRWELRWKSLQVPQGFQLILVVKGFISIHLGVCLIFTISTPLISLGKIQGEKGRHFLGSDC